MKLNCLALFTVLLLNVGAAHLSVIRLDPGPSKVTKYLRRAFDSITLVNGPPEFEAQLDSDKEICDLCEDVIKVVIPVAELEEVYPKVVEFAKWLCNREQWYTERVCNGAVDMFKEEFYAVLPVIAKAPHSTCSKLLKLDCGDEDNPVTKWWNVTIPPANIPEPRRRRTLPRRTRQGQTLRILHISDVHLDPWYSVGSEANCIEPLCCRPDSPPHKNASKHRAAGKFGDYSCDTPLLTLSSMLSTIVKKHQQVDAIYLTGDMTPHDVWNQTRTKHNSTITTVLSMIKSTFGKTPVYMAVGNHEGMPVNAFPTPETALPGTQNMSWLYDSVMVSYLIRKSGWLPNDTAPEILKSGSYTTLLKPGWRVVSINNNYCNQLNWWLLRNSTDPTGELEWLVQWLHYAESHGERVHLLMHIPTGGGDCLQVWSWNFYSIMYRFHKTIAALFSGHTHKLYYVVYYDDQNFTTPTGINLVGPSITPNGQRNPGYRLVTVDTATADVVDYDIYYVDLPASNKNGSLQVAKLYSAKSAFGLANLSPASWHNLTLRMNKDDALFENFYSWENRLAGAPPCDADCKRKLLCKLISSRSHDSKMCDRFLPKF